MLSRRQFIHATMILSGGMLMASCTAISGVEADPGGLTSVGEQGQWHMPDEGEPHQRTWMAFGASEEIWGEELLSEVRRNLATIAQTIAKYEPVTLLVRESETDLACELVGPDVELIVAPLDDLWLRDTGPVFVANRARRNGWCGLQLQRLGREAGV